jgi:hypothetical protein
VPSPTELGGSLSWNTFPPPATELLEDNVLTPSRKDRVVGSVLFVIYESSPDPPTSGQIRFACAGLAHDDSHTGMTNRLFLSISNICLEPNSGIACERVDIIPLSPPRSLYLDSFNRHTRNLCTFGTAPELVAFSFGLSGRVFSNRPFRRCLCTQTHRV